MKRTLSIILFIACALVGHAQSLVINQSLELVAMSSAVSQYNNQFGRFNNPDLDEPFPYAVVCINLTGDVRAAKEVINLDLGSYIAVEATNRDVENTILFLVPRSAKNIYITCGEGCEKKLLWNRGAMQSNKVYQCKVEYKKIEETAASDEQMQAMMRQVEALQQQVLALQNGQQSTAPAAQPTSSKTEDESLYVMVEQMPEFPGGQQALFKFISQNLVYPVEAQEKKLQGRVLCQFVVSKDGTIRDIEVIRSSGYESLDRSAIRVIKSMPKWKPGIQKGAPVNVKYTIPINFSLQ